MRARQTLRWVLLGAGSAFGLMSVANADPQHGWCNGVGNPHKSSSCSSSVPTWTPPTDAKPPVTQQGPSTGGPATQTQPQIPATTAPYVPKRPPTSRHPAVIVQPPLVQPPVTQQAPVAQPPAQQPPVVQPVLQPPLVQPPVTQQAPVAQPPAQQPPVVQPVLQPPLVQPPVTQQAPVAQPPAQQPPVVQPVLQPPLVQPPVTQQAPVAQPPAQQPPVVQPINVPPLSVPGGGQGPVIGDTGVIVTITGPGGNKVPPVIARPRPRPPTHSRPAIPSGSLPPGSDPKPVVVLRPLDPPVFETVSGGRGPVVQPPVTTNELQAVQGKGPAGLRPPLTDALDPNLYVPLQSGRHPAHDLPAFHTPKGAARCLFSGYGRRYWIDANGQRHETGVEASLRGFGPIMRDVPAFTHHSAGCVLLVFRREDWQDKE